MVPYDAFCCPLQNCQLHTLQNHQVPQPAHPLCDLMRCGFDERCPLLLHVVRSSCDTGVYGLTYTIGHSVKSWCEHLDSEHTPPGKSLPLFWESVHPTRWQCVGSSLGCLCLRSGGCFTTCKPPAHLTLPVSREWCEETPACRPPLETPILCANPRPHAHTP